MKNVFADFHHSGLGHSLKLLLEDRLGYNLFFPIGMEWAEEKWWQIHKPYNFNLDTAKQYLQIKPEYHPIDKTPILNHIVSERPTHYEVEDLHEHYIRKCITLEQFKEMDIDIIIASIPDHFISFTKLRDKYKPNAKVICQTGNMFVEIRDLIANGTVKNLMASTSEFPVSCNAVFYHQEFPLDVFKPSSRQPEKLISSFINCYSNNAGYQDYLGLKAEMPDWEFRSYGGGNPDGVISGIENVALGMQRSAWGFHVKHMGDGWGHVLWNWAFVGKPIITRISDYKDKIGGKILEHGETCIDLDTCNYNEVYGIISTMSPDKYMWMCQEIRRRAEKEANFKEDEVKIKDFLNKLK